MSTVHSSAPFSGLSQREHEVLRCVAQDKTDREIAHQLGIRERTVRAHVSRIILKLGVSSRVGAAVALVEWAMGGKRCHCNGSATAETPMATPGTSLPRSEPAPGR